MPRVPLILTNKTFKNMTDLENYIVECIIKSDGYNDCCDGSVWVEYGRLTIDCDYSIVSEGYYDNDYFNGTGAFEETYYNFSIDDLKVYDEDGNDVEVNVEAIEKELNQR